MKTEDTPNDIHWIDWHGGACPVPRSTKTGLRYRDGTEVETTYPEQYRWRHADMDSDIIAYRIPAQPVAQESDEKQDEHGNPIACMYRIKFPDPNTESYFYTERSYRILESRLRAQSAELDRSKADAKAARAGCCTVCWTNSFEPCEESDQGAVAYKDGTGFVRCQHCYMIEGFRKCKADLAAATAQLAERDAQVAELLTVMRRARPSEVWDKARMYYTGDSRPDEITNWHRQLCKEFESAITNAATSKPQP